MVNGPSPGPAPAAQARDSNSRRHPIQLADVAPPEAAQESSQGGWRLDYAADGASCPAGTQHVGVVNEVAPSQRRGHQGQHLVSWVRSPRLVSQVGLGSPGGAPSLPLVGRRYGCGRDRAIYRCSLFGVGFALISKPLSQIHRWVPSCRSCQDGLDHFALLRLGIRVASGCQ